MSLEAVKTEPKIFEKSKNYLLYSLSFFVWPFGSLIMALRKTEKKEAITIFFLYSIFFGFCFIIPGNQDNPADSVSYADTFHNYYLHHPTFSQLLGLFYNSENGYTDVYQPLMTWFISFFTGDSRWLFMSYAVIFGYFMTKNFWLLLSQIKGRTTILMILFLFSFYLLNPIWNINGVRMWTAAQIFLFGTLQYFLKGNKSGLAWCFLSIFVHFSFVIYFALVIGYLIIPKNIQVFFIFYIATLTISEINYAGLSQGLSFLPDIFLRKIEIYTNEQYAVAISKQLVNYTWHIRYSAYVSRWVIYIWVIMIYLRRSKWQFLGPVTENLFLFGLFVGGWANLASLFPSGDRIPVLVGRPCMIGACRQRQ